MQEPTHNIAWAIICSSEEVIKENIKCIFRRRNNAYTGTFEPDETDNDFKNEVKKAIDSTFVLRDLDKQIISTFPGRYLYNTGHDSDNALTGISEMTVDDIIDLLEDCKDVWQADRRCSYYASVNYTPKLIAIIQDKLHPSVHIDVEFYDIPEWIMDKYISSPHYEAHRA